MAIPDLKRFRITGPDGMIPIKIPLATRVTVLAAAIFCLSAFGAAQCDRVFVFVAGGYDNLGDYSSEVDYYDVTSKRWLKGGNLAEARIEFGGVELRDGTFLIAGGSNTHTTFDGGVTTAEIYSVATGLSTIVAPLHVPRAGATMVKLLDGRVLIAGGNDQTGTPVASAEIYDPARGNWRLTKSLMSSPRNAGAATLLADGRVLISGGISSSAPFAVTATADVYDPARDVFTSTGPMSDGRCYFTQTLLPSGKVLVSGGANETAYLASQDLFDPSRLTFTPTAPMKSPRAGLSASLLHNGTVLLASGASGADSSGNPVTTRTAEIYDPLTHSSKLTSHEMTIDRQGAFQVTLADGTVLIGGGGINDGSEITNSVEIYEPQSEKFVSVGTMSTPRGLVPAIPFKMTGPVFGHFE